METVGRVPPADTESVAFEGGDSHGVRATETTGSKERIVVSVAFE